MALNARLRARYRHDMRPFTLELSSALRASVEEVWSHASTMEGVNHELAPWVRMTVPKAVKGKRLGDVPPDKVGFTSVVLLFAVIPFDVHHLSLEQIFDNGFDEQSWSWLNRSWRHERRVDPTANGCIVTDRLTVDPRWAPVFLVRHIVQLLFLARHRKLRARFG